MAHAKRLPVDAVAAAARSKPNLLREIFTGLGLGVFCESRILCLSVSLCVPSIFLLPSSQDFIIMFCGLCFSWLST
jgi:hypothetical protein